jgi:hypothetical protein
MCLRNIHGGIENPNLIPTDWTIDDFKTIFNQEVLNQIRVINFCGDFGDPIINNDLIKMCEYIKDTSDIQVIIHTNGSARHVEWWEKLAVSLPIDHNVIFALDGLETTHSIHRAGTEFRSIIRNASAFINNGGTAEWSFIRFKHNQHQEEDAEMISRRLGFKKFTLKNSKRFTDKFPVLDKNGTVTHYIEQPTNSNFKPINFYTLKDYKSWKGNNEINCYTINEYEAYIDAHKRLMPCCLIGSFVGANYDYDLYKKLGVANKDSIVPIAFEAQNNVNQLINEFGGFEKLDVLKHSIKKIMDDPLWEGLIKSKWKSAGSIPCVLLCSKATPFISVEEQFINHAE